MDSTSQELGEFRSRSYDRRATFALWRRGLWGAVALSACVLCTSGCTIPFTRDLLGQLDQNGVDLANVQFYNATTIELEREIDSADADVSSGKIIVREGKYIEVVRIRTRTPGLWMETIDQRQNEEVVPCLRVAFEPGDERDLAFCPGRWGTFIQEPDWVDGIIRRVRYDGNRYALTACPKERLLQVAAGRPRRAWTASR